ncbi:MAG: type II toxin-antitoxin system death-on-curing family toxin [Fimbriimonadaceae bacterium]|nr:type II toxin-antitoxin system death-on-curing family toxin [Chthonomonadaceae bacterium]MCO5297223.1 type II toxin-antitoxin system death-on-curing family toxin [Fimbriimonadaceae bacterium]
MEYLSVEEVVDIHAETLRLNGGSPGILDFGRLESAIGAARQTFDGRPLYDTIGSVAAALWHSLSSNHPFVDGNKRTAAIAAAYFAHKNRWELALDDDQIIEIGLGMADGTLDRADVLSRVEAAARPME